MESYKWAVAEFNKRYGLDDNYFLVSDEETGAMHFDSDRFRRFLEMAEKFGHLESRVGLYLGERN